jgi:hypothetical protein
MYQTWNECERENAEYATRNETGFWKSETTNVLVFLNEEKMETEIFQFLKCIFEKDTRCISCRVVDVEN